MFFFFFIFTFYRGGDLVENACTRCGSAPRLALVDHDVPHPAGPQYCIANRCSRKKKTSAHKQSKNMKSEQFKPRCPTEQAVRPVLWRLGRGQAGLAGRQAGQPASDRSIDMPPRPVQPALRFGFLFCLGRFDSRRF